MTLSFIDSLTYRICIGDQLTAIDDWLRIQPGFVLSQDKVFRSPYDEAAFTIDLTWQQYYRRPSSTSGKTLQRREPLTMIKKDPLLPLKYEGDIEVELEWKDIPTDSIVRAVVQPPFSCSWRCLDCH
jgi:hypothetical protein